MELLNFKIKNINGSKLFEILGMEDAAAAQGAKSKSAGSISLKERVANIKWSSVMVINLPSEASVRDIWLFFNKQRKIKDIILSRKRDRNNNRIGFLIVDSKQVGDLIVSSFNGRKMGRQESKVKSKTGETHGKTRNHPTQEHADNLVPQPSCRTVVGTVDEEFKSILGRSLIGITAEVEWADVIQENIIGLGCSFIRVRGISHKSFLLIVDEDVFTANVNIEFLYEIFLGVYKATHSDLVVPRLAWLDCDGLPISAWNNSTWSKIIDDWGYLVTENKKPLLNSMYTKLKLCIATSKVEQIKETIKVVIDEREDGSQEKSWRGNKSKVKDFEEVQKQKEKGDVCPSVPPSEGNDGGAVDSVEKLVNEKEGLDAVEIETNGHLMDEVNEDLNSLSRMGSFHSREVGNEPDESMPVEEIQRYVWQVRDKNNSSSALSKEDDSIQILESVEADNVGYVESSMVSEKF
ncbi:hypothetical protein DCAR_0519637 [Daucus carota subsp. sativus]|uniref:RRM domain-containing protein n=1 Tax=Daucus carota subsp. sativus TaxID=79200 RepID=A0A161ZZQ2_DAUCS|nr:hypothetical protein DCAR_0519637 [Daucus carota subsp. sativus]